MAHYSQDQIQSRIDFIKGYISSANAASGSKYNSNANVTKKTVTTLEVAMNEDINILTNRAMRKDQLTKDHGKRLANEYVRQIQNHEIYVHDETHLMPYCVSISLMPYLLRGIKDLGGESDAPKHIDSFCGSFIDLVESVSSEVCGAVATGEFFMAFDYFARKDYGKNYLATHGKKVENHFQNVVYRANQPSAARGAQSVFWNISVYDREYLVSLFHNFIFPDGGKPDFESIMELQKFFMTWFNKERLKTLLTFPVVTAAILKDSNTLLPKDEDFARFLAKEKSEGNSFFVYTSDSPDSLASCCFSYTQEVLIKLHEFDSPLKIQFGNLYKKLEEEGNLDKELLIFNHGRYEKGKIIKVPYSGLWYSIRMKSGQELLATKDHLFPTQCGDVRADELIKSIHKISTFDFDNQTSSYKDIQDIHTIKQDADSYCFEMTNQIIPYFTLANGITVHNCRLRNSIKENTFSYTLGSVGIMTGSAHVITMNMNRFVQDTYNDYIEDLPEHFDINDEKNFDTFLSVLKKKLAKQVDKIHRYHSSTRKIFEDLFIKNDMILIYKHGFISLKKQYSTIGINGMVESAEFLGIRPNVNDKYLKYVGSLLKVIFDQNISGTEKYGCMFNTEFVPAENLGVKNALWDKEDGYVVTRDCYNSYFYVVEDQTINAIDKFILHGEQILQYLDGGSALHLNLDDYLDAEQYYQLICLACKTGCNYFCTNVKITICEDCNHIDKHTLTTCPKCGSTHISHATRIIGYLKKTSNFSVARQKEEAIRHHHTTEFTNNEAPTTTSSPLTNIAA